MDASQLIAEGWSSIEAGGLTGELGPFWVRGTSTNRELGFVAQNRHGNNHIGTVHGGMIMMFADTSLGYGVCDALGGFNCATAQLQLQFVAAARIGEFFTCRPELVRQTSQLVFMRGLIVSGGKTVASADGIWKVLERRAL